MYCPPRSGILQCPAHTLGISPRDFKGKQLQCNHKSQQQSWPSFPWHPKYWPRDNRKISDLIDFAITKNIPRSLISAESLSDLSSEHSPVLINRLRHTITEDYPTGWTSHKTYWIWYRKYLSSHIELSPVINLEAEISTTESAFVTAACISTPQTAEAFYMPKKTNQQIEQLLLEKRRIWRKWQSHSRHLHDKGTHFSLKKQVPNAGPSDLEKIIDNNDNETWQRSLNCLVVKT